MKIKVLVIGATGRIGPGFLEEYLKNYENHYEIILGVRGRAKVDKFKTRKLSLKKIGSLKKAMRKIDVVVNLAANSNANATFDEVLKPNIIGAYNVFEAAKESKVKRIVFASSIHAVKGYSHDKIVQSKDAPKPSGFYGASKAYGESLCYLFSEKYGLSCIAIRIGAYVSNDKQETVCYTRDDYGHIISQRDFAQLIHKSILAPMKLKYAILHGISNDRHRHLDLKETKKLVGYRPQDDAYKICNAIKTKGLK